LLAEMGDNKNILIHPHRFSPDRLACEATAGTFNVGFVGFRVSDEARACAGRWREQVLALCVKDPEKGLCGDQGYLNESLTGAIWSLSHAGAAKHIFYRVQFWARGAFLMIDDGRSRT
jgi:hypothetical protein